MKLAQAAVGDITAEPMLSDSEIATVTKQILESASHGHSSESNLAIWSSQFNNLLYDSEIGDEQSIVSQIDEIFDAFVKYSVEKYKDVSGTSSSEIIENFIRLVNLFLKLLKIKKVYNTIPRQDFTDFYKNEDHTQILQLTLRRNEDIGRNRMNHGGSCHNWSIIFKEYFDTLGIKSSVIFCKPFSNHSFTLVKIGDRFFSFDPILRKNNEYLSEINIGDCIYIGQDFSGRIIKLSDDNNGIDIEIETEENGKGFEAGIKSKLEKYDELGEFTSMLDSREIDYIIFGYRKKNDFGFRLEFEREDKTNFFFTLILENKSPNKERVDSKISSSILIAKFLQNFLQNFFGRNFQINDIKKIIKQYFQKSSDLGLSQNSLLSEDEQIKLQAWISSSNNFELFLDFFGAQPQGFGFSQSLFSKKNHDLLDEFRKSTNLMHKRSVVKFLCLGILLPKIELIDHSPDTYSRKVDTSVRGQKILAEE